MVDPWVNYDCNVEGEDLFERLVKFLSRADEVARSKANKRLLLEGAAAFHRKPKVGLRFLEEHGIICLDPKVPRPESLARFLKTTPRLDKRLLGEFILRPDMIDVLKSFLHLMEFEGQKMICDALRELLEALHLPGESQQINRIAKTFAEVYFATKPPEIKSQDATYVLTYLVIMLNTDAHSPQVRKRMYSEAYSRNLRGVNDGENFDPEYLRAIFESIRKREIVLPEEHQNQVGFEYGWKELLRRSRRTGSFTLHRTNMFDRGMFAIAWKPLVSAMSFAFANFRNDYMVQRAIGGFNHCAALAARFGMPEVFDYLIAISFDFLSRLPALANSFSSLFDERVVELLLRLVTEVIKSDELRAASTRRASSVHHPNHPQTASCAP
ncbi:hypothetical protein Rhopal_001821-T1 [Rhodotorula paludigena]|uniref:SEC7 domain-containing protein n=1 Tax=Rhodotorula paludigena TaxID=86838 RepID=A0AAV5G8L1_9BASI|nr:hypothetical protein Rhopal_001821-T1 [Rhodotorula paludigena]